MEFTALKRNGITRSWTLVTLTFGGGSIYLLLKDVPHNGLYKFQLSCLVSLTVGFLGVVLYWVAFPRKHPIERALAVYGDVTAISMQLNDEIEAEHEVQGPFSFTSSFLVYSPGYTLNLVRYDDVLLATKRVEDDTTRIEVHTKRGKSYTWSVSVIQGKFSPDEVLLRIKQRASLPISK